MISSVSTMLSLEEDTSCITALINQEVRKLRWANSIHAEFQFVINHVAVLVSHLENSRQIVLVATNLIRIDVTQVKFARLWPLLKSTIVILNLTYNYERRWIIDWKILY